MWLFTSFSLSMWVSLAQGFIAREGRVMVEPRLMDTPLQWTPLYSGHPSTVDTYDIMDNSQSPDCPSIHFNT